MVYVIRFITLINYLKSLWRVKKDFAGWPGPTLNPFDLLEMTENVGSERSLHLSESKEAYEPIDKDEDDKGKKEKTSKSHTVDLRWGKIQFVLNEKKKKKAKNSRNADWTEEESRKAQKVKGW